MANETPNNEEIIAESNRNDKDGRPLTTTRLTPESDTNTVAILQAPLVVIPIIFIPGIMGTNLQNLDGTVVWNPPNMDGVGPLANAIGQLIKYKFTNAAERQTALNPLTTQVYYSGSVDAEGAISNELARIRGWGALSRSAYQPMISRLQKELNKIMEMGKIKAPWDGDALREPSDYGEQKGQKALTEDDLKHAANYRFDVWGGGYNWTKSNRDSSLELIDYIEKTVLASYAKVNEKADKVILVTHSMGGLVARAICNIHNYSKVLGVVHGVMPATGAAATYHHARCGYEGVAATILGRNAAEVVAVMGNSPGALELIPSAEYNGGKPWLKLGGLKDENPQLPVADPYDEIYKSKDWYGLIPQRNEYLLDPAKINTKAISADSESVEKKRTLRIIFDGKIDKVQDFHKEILKKYPKPAYVTYGDDAGQKTWSTVHWKGDELFDYIALDAISDNQNGKISVGSKDGPIPLEFGKALEPGDGTVPAVSGAAPSDFGVTAMFRQGDQGTGNYVKTNTKGKAKGYEHQDSYNDVRAQWATLYSIIKIAKDANWHA
jgi:pimeloyl-ACP methyl ester carboxylesterase